MSKTTAAEGNVLISRWTWDWARSKPEYTRLIEDIEDIEAIRMAKKESKETVSLDDVIVGYEKTHKVKLKR